MTFDEVLEHFPHRRRNTPTDWHASCLGHADSTTDPDKYSLHITLAGDKILLHCFAGCSQNRVLEAAKLTPADLFIGTNGHGHAPTADPPRAPEVTPTLALFAQLKRIPQGRLEADGWRNHDDGIAIPYPTRDGATWRMRYRTSLRSGAGFKWDGQKDRPLVPYGRHRLDQVMEKGELWLVEGESDAITAWTRGLPCLGIPGNLAVKALTAEDLVGIEKLWIVLEPGQSGEGFARALKKRLAELDYAGKAFLVTLPAKDISDLHVLKGPEFWPAIKLAQEQAVDLATWSARSTEPPPDDAEAPTEDAAASAPWAWATSFRGAAITRAVVQRPTFLIEDLLSRAHQHAIIGPSGSAKTWLEFALAVAVGVPEVTTFLGQPVTVHGPVVIESWEQGVDEDLRRLQKLLRGHGLSTAPDTLILQSMPFLTLQDEAAYQARLRDLRDAQVVLYAFDSLSEGAGIELNDNTAYTAWWRTRVRPLLDLGITVAFTHLRGHLKPGTRGDRDAAFRGATQIRGLSTAVLECRHLSATTSLLIHNKHRNTGELPLGILTLTGAQEDPAITLDLSALPDAAGKGDRARQQLIEFARLHPAGITRKMIEADLNAPGKAKGARISRKIYNPALSALELDGTFEAFTQGNTDAWRLVAVAADDEGDDD